MVIIIRLSQQKRSHFLFLSPIPTSGFSSVVGFPEQAVGSESRAESHS